MRILKLLLLMLVCAVPARAEVDKKAERNWKAKCASCHGADGKGQTDQGKKLKVEDMSSAFGTYKTFWIEDYVTLVGQGAIADRAHEQLGRTDQWLVLKRHLWQRELKALAERRPLFDVAREEKIMPDKDLRRVLDPLPMTKGGVQD